MGQRNLLIVGIAVFIGLIAVFLANSYFSGVQNRQAELVEQNKVAQVVVATQDLAFGAPLSAQNVRLAAWPAASVPVGAFTSIEEATRNRVALRPIVPGEPVLASKVSGANGRATLSANLPPGALAFTIPISDVAGVGGFVRPGDLVDVMLTRKIPGPGSSDSDKTTDVVLEAVPVLGIDQVADEKSTDPAVGKTATLQVDSYSAQKLALSTQLGVMSLALRNMTDQPQGYRQTVTQRDISVNRYYVGARPGAGGGAGPASVIVRTLPAAATLPSAIGLPTRPLGPSMTVVRGIKTTQEEVIRGR